MIYKIIIISFLFLLSYSCNTEQNADGQISSDVVFNPNTAKDTTDKSSQLPKITFDHKDFDFGLIFEGEEVSHKYKFENTGGKALIISDVSATCGCTIPSYTKKPIAPGEEGVVEVKFNSSGRNGMQHKSVIVLSNTQPNRIELTFVAEIEASN